MFWVKLNLSVLAYRSIFYLKVWNSSSIFFLKTEQNWIKWNRKWKILRKQSLLKYIKSNPTKTKPKKTTSRNLAWLLQLIYMSWQKYSIPSIPIYEFNHTNRNFVFFSSNSENKFFWWRLNSFWFDFGKLTRWNLGKVWLSVRNILAKVCNLCIKLGTLFGIWRSYPDCPCVHNTTIEISKKDTHLRKYTHFKESKQCSKVFVMTIEFTF